VSNGKRARPCPIHRSQEVCAVARCRLLAGLVGHQAEPSAIAADMSDNETARAVTETRDRLFAPAGPPGAPAPAAKPPSGGKKDGGP